jgi:protein gp37
MSQTKIEWTDVTWNPVRGCSCVSPGCANCYARPDMAKKNSNPKLPGCHGFAFFDKKHRPHWTGRVELVEHKLDEPLHWREPRRVFVNSMSDLFHENLSVEAIQRIFDVMRRADWHTFQILTKRSQRLRELSAMIDWPANVWMGVSIETAEYAWRADDLRAAGATVKFLSVEPLLGPVQNLDLSGIGWIIVGGESGPRARPMEPQWARDARGMCRREDVPFFFKQWGGKRKKEAGRTLDGRTWDEFPQ